MGESVVTFIEANEKKRVCHVDADVLVTEELGLELVDKGDVLITRFLLGTGVGVVAFELELAGLEKLLINHSGLEVNKLSGRI